MHFTHLFVSLITSKILSLENTIRKTRFLLHFTHLFVSLIASKILSLENTKENFAFFCILLTYSYLCSPKTR